MKEKIRTPAQEVAEAYRLINKVINPLTRGDGGNHKGEGGDKHVIAARRAYGALQIIRQYAKVGASVSKFQP